MNWNEILRTNLHSAEYIKSLVGIPYRQVNRLQALKCT